MKLMDIDEWTSKYFSEDSRPDRKTVRGWIEKGHVPGMQLGGKLYVDVTLWEQQTAGDELVNKILRKAS